MVYLDANHTHSLYSIIFPMTMLNRLMPLNQRQTPILLILVLVLSSILTGCLHDKKTEPATTNPGNNSNNGNNAGNNPDLPTVKVSILEDDNVKIPEGGGGSIVLIILLDKASDKEISVGVSLRPITATPNNDFSFENQGRNALSKQVKIAAGRLIPDENIRLRIFQDDLVEGDETFSLTVRAPGTNAPEPVTYTIVDDDPLPKLRILDIVDDVVVSREAGETEGVLKITVELYPSALLEDLDVPFTFISTADAETRATIGGDFSNPSFLRIAAETRKATLTISPTGDAIIENTETFTFKLLPPEGIELGTLTSVILSIIDDDTIKDLNETGQTLCADATNPVKDCSETAEFPAQDANFTRNAGVFNLEILGADGSTELTVDNPATCAQDLNTNLTWELKTSEPGFQYHSNLYSWFNSKTNANGGNTGFSGNTAGCGSSAVSTGENGATNQNGPDACDTEKYAAYLSQEKLCNKTGWRTPSVSELLSLFAFSNTIDNETFIDRDSFPNFQPGYYWTAAPSILDIKKAWMVYLGKELTEVTDYTDTDVKSNSRYLILVTNE